MEQVITVFPDGSISGLQHKQGQGIDLRTFGKASIKRASEVIFDDDYQLWYVQFCNAGAYSGKHLTVSMLDEAKALELMTAPSKDGRAMFDDYDKAVRSEVAVLNNIRLKNPASLHEEAAAS